MKFTKILAMAAVANAAAVTEGNECVKDVDTCTADNAANAAECCNLRSTLFTVLKTTMCVDKTAQYVTDKQGGVKYEFCCSSGDTKCTVGATYLASTMMAAASAIYMMQ